MMGAAPAAGITGTAIETMNLMNNEVVQENFQQQMIEANRFTPLYLCQFKNPTYVNHCWAAAELRCPHYMPTNYNVLPGGISYENLLAFRVQIQAQLRFLNERSPDGKSENFAKDNNPQYYHPGTISGNIGSIAVDESAETLTLDTNKPLQILQTTHDGKLTKVRFVDDAGRNQEVLVETGLIGANGRLSTSINGCVGELQTEEESKTRVAIYFFKKVHGLLNYDNYANNFSFYTDDDSALASFFDNAGITALNNVCQALIDATD